MRQWTLIITLISLVAIGIAPFARADDTLHGFSTTAALGDDVPLPEEEAFAVEAVALDEGQILVRFTMPDGYYLYRDRARFLLEGEDQAEAVIEWPQAVAHHDEHFGAVAVFYGQIEVPLSFTHRADESAPKSLLVRLQGCKENSVCYPPMQRKFTL